MSKRTRLCASCKGNRLQGMIQSKPGRRKSLSHNKWEEGIRNSKHVLSSFYYRIMRETNIPIYGKDQICSMKPCLSEFENPIEGDRKQDESLEGHLQKGLSESYDDNQPIHSIDLYLEILIIYIPFSLSVAREEIAIGTSRGMIQGYANRSSLYKYGKNSG